MDKKPDDLMQDGLALFTRIIMKYSAWAKEPLDLGNGVKLNASHIHTLEAIGKEYGKTVTALSEYFMITKGAVSQVIAKLDKEGYVTRSKKKGNKKEILLALTPKGWQAFELHEKYNAWATDDLRQIRHKYTDGELRLFLGILSDIDAHLSQFVAKEKK